MALSLVEANKLTNPSLTQGVTEVFLDRGTRDHYALLPFKEYEGTAFEWNMEKTLPGGYANIDPYGSTSIVGGVGTRNRLSIKAAALMRHVDTAEIDVIGKSDINDQHAEDLLMGAKAFAQQHRRDFFYGNGTYNEGTGYNLSGLDYFLDKYAGRYQSGALVSPTWGNFQEQKFFPTTGANAGTPYGTKATFDYDWIDDLITREKGMGFDVIFSDRNSFLAFKTQLNAIQGNTAPMLMDERFGKPVYEYNGVLWVINDAVGAEKTSSMNKAASVSLAATTGELTVNLTTDPFFPGFQDLDIGREFEIYDNPPETGGSVIASGVITDITGAATAETDHTGGAVTGYLVLKATPAIYAIRYNDIDGVCAVYHKAEGTSVNAGEYNAPIVGFVAERIGALEDAPLLRTRLKWYGNYAALSPYSVARLSHYSLA